MAIDSIGVGTFIPNAAGLPESLAKSPAEKAQEVSKTQEASGQENASGQSSDDAVPVQSQEQTSSGGNGDSGISNTGESIVIDIEV